ncbi:MAG: ribosome maturation factor RimP [Proteobacteria bacterium]|nr:ribosome maturation factor RimP [Pseudomonadota bacterium]
MRDALRRLLEPEVSALGFELVELEFHPHRGGGLLRLYIDCAEGVAEGVRVEDCEAVSRRVSAALDAADPIPGEYTLEVSSPGLDRPLTAPAHFRRFAGSRVRVESLLPRAGRRRWTGRLAAVGETGVTLEVDGQAVELGFAEIKTARLVPEYGTGRE